MSKQPLSQAYRDLLYLIRCAVRQEQVDVTWSCQTPLATLFRLACFHSIEAFLYDTVKQLPLTEKDNSALKDWQVAYDKAFRRYLLFTTERHAILSEFEKAGIWYLPLKGVVLQNDYPQPHLRQMSDNDILFDKERRYDVKDIMVGRGYKVGRFNYQFDDVYYKDPLYNFEMHVQASVAPEFESYFEELPQRLDKLSDYARQMRGEDFYLYFLSHELKHYQLSGSGLRFLIDLQIYLTKHSQALDWEHIDRVLKDLGVTEFDRQRRLLVANLFDADLEVFSQVLEDSDVLAYFCTSGAYGTFEQAVEKRLCKKDGSKHSFISFYLQRFFKIDNLILNYPILQKHRYLIPFYMIFRIVRGFFRPRNWKELFLVIKKTWKRFQL